MNGINNYERHSGVSAIFLESTNFGMEFYSSSKYPIRACKSFTILGSNNIRNGSDQPSVDKNRLSEIKKVLYLVHTFATVSRSTKVPVSEKRSWGRRIYIEWTPPKSFNSYYVSVTLKSSKVNTMYTFVLDSCFKKYVHSWNVADTRDWHSSISITFAGFEHIENSHLHSFLRFYSNYIQNCPTELYNTIQWPVFFSVIELLFYRLAVGWTQEWQQKRTQFPKFNIYGISAPFSNCSSSTFYIFCSPASSPTGGD